MAVIYIEYSDGGKYKLSTVYPFRHNDDGMPTYAIISSTATDEILVVDTVPYDAIVGEHLWHYSKYGSYLYPSNDDLILGYGDTNEKPWLKLPPSLWQKLHTWIAINVRGFEYPKSVDEYLEEKILFVKNGGDINAQDSYGRTSLMYAAHYVKIDIVKFLLENSADSAIEDNDSKRALSWASTHRHKELMKLLIDADNTPISLVEAASLGHTERVKLLVDSGDKLNNGAALLSVSESGYIEIVELLIDSGADINYSNNFDSVLSIAACRGHTKIVQLLVKKGVDINANKQPRYGNSGTALIEASRVRRNMEIVKILLENGVDVNAKDSFENTALMFAANNEIIKLLQSAGAKE